MSNQRLNPPWRNWYKTARWQRLRQDVFLRDLFKCQMVGCGRLIGNDRDRICDHKEPHRGDEERFWDVNNLQTLCKDCHDTKKQQEEQKSLHTRGIWH